MALNDRREPAADGTDQDARGLTPRTGAHQQHPSVFALQGRHAGLVTRSLANAVDFGLTLAILALGYLAVAAVRFLWDPRAFTFPAPPLGLVIVAGSWVAGIYFAIGWMATGRTYGDYVLGLRVVSRSGRRLRPGQAALRAAACVVFPIGLLWVVISTDNRSVQDILLRTRVVYDWSVAPPNP